MQTATVKLNNLTWLLTGRSSGFAYPPLNTLISEPLTTDNNVRLARQLLRLDIRGCDFFVYGALAALYTNLYHIRFMEAHQQANFIRGIIPMVSRTNAVYERDTNGDFAYSGGAPVEVAGSNVWTFLPFYDETTVSVAQNPIFWPDPHDSLKLELSGSNVTVTKYWQGAARDSAVIPATVNGNLVQLDAMAFAGLRASFDTNSAAFSFLNTPPTVYPYGLVRSLIADDTTMIGLMRDAGTVEAFHAATSDMVAVGAFAAAIVLTERKTAVEPTYGVLPDGGLYLVTDDDPFAQGDTVSDTVPEDDPASTFRIPVIFETTKVTTPCNE